MESCVPDEIYSRGIRENEEGIFRKIEKKEPPREREALFMLVGCRFIASSYNLIHQSGFTVKNGYLNTVLGIGKNDALI